MAIDAVGRVINRHIEIAIQRDAAAAGHAEAQAVVALSLQEVLAVGHIGIGRARVHIDRTGFIAVDLLGYLDFFNRGSRIGGLLLGCSLIDLTLYSL